MSYSLKTLWVWLFLLVASGYSAATIASDFFQRFIDPADGMFDMSEWLLDRKGVLPVPIIITEPAVGFGGGAALVFFRESLREAARERKEGAPVAPPDIFGMAAFATENGTKGVAAGGQWTFRDDRYRVRSGVGDFSINLDFYGIGDQLPIDIGKVGYTLKGFGSFQQGMVRLGESNVFVGIRWIYLDLNAKLDVEADLARLTPKQRAKRSSGLGVALEHDSRDNIFTPNRGWLGQAAATFYDQAIGSSNDFQEYRGNVFSYLPLAADLTLGLRADARLAQGDVPFYLLPYISLRGIPAAQFQASHIAVVEAELRYDVSERWALVGFFGTGRAWGSRTSFEEADKPIAGGAGFRYLLARRLGLYVGMDYAWSSVDRAFYIQVGSAWR